MGNPVVHWELNSTKAPELQAFYADVFGWGIDSDNPMDYGMVQTQAEGGINGGIGPVEEGEDQDWITFYIGVDDLNAYLNKVGEKGGSTLVPPTEIPGGLTFALFLDPGGNRVGLVKN